MSNINIEELINKIKQMTEDGFSPSRISVILDIHVREIKKIVKENNFTIKKEPFDESKIEKIVDLYERGVGKNRLREKFSIDGRRILRWAEERGVRRTQEEARRIIQFNENYFDEINSPDKAYWLGFLYADGCNHGDHRVTLGLQKSDYEHIEKFADALSFPRRTIRYSEGNASGFGGNGSVNISINSQHMASTLSKHGCVPAKSLVLTYPEWMDKELEVHFIRGLFDGDGSCNLRESYGEWGWNIAGTKSICEGIQRVIEDKFEFSPRIEIGKSVHTVNAKGNTRIHKIMEWLYSNSTYETRLNRKYDTYLKLVEFQNNRTFTRKAYKVSDEDKLQILEKVNAGHQISQVAKEFQMIKF